MADEGVTEEGQTEGTATDSAPGAEETKSLASQATETSQGEGGGGAGQAQEGAEKPWYADFPEDIRKGVEKFTGGPQDLAKSYVELQRKLGVWPGDDASEEEKQAYFAKIGRPDSPDAYELDAGILPEGIGDRDKLIADFKKSAHEAGLAPYQAKMMLQAQAAEVKRQVEQARKAREDAESALRSEWGEDYDKNLALVGKVLNRFGSQETLTFLDKTGAGNDPAFVRMLAGIAQVLSDDTLEGGAAAAAGSEEREEGILEYPNTPELDGEGRWGNIRRMRRQ